MKKNFFERFQEFLKDNRASISLEGFELISPAQKAILNFPRLEILFALKKANEPLSLMELSRRVNTSKTNCEHHVRVMEQVGIVKIEHAKNELHQPLKISLVKDETPQN